MALSGDGGDELLGGYGRYARAFREVSRAARFPGLALAAARQVAARLPWWMRGTARLGRLSSELDAYYASGFRNYVPKAWPPVLDGRLAGPWPDVVATSLRENAGRPPLLRFMSSDMTCYLPEDILVKVDRASMAVGLEVRAPLLDHRLTELVLRADPSWLVDTEGAKAPLRQLYAGRLPEAVFARRKMGFGVPLRHWLKADLGALARERLLSPRPQLAPLLDRKEVGALLRSHASDQRNEAPRIWHLLVLDAWLDRWRPSLRAEKSELRHSA